MECLGVQRECHNYGYLFLLLCAQRKVNINIRILIEYIRNGETWINHAVVVCSSLIQLVEP